MSDLLSKLKSMGLIVPSSTIPQPKNFSKSIPIEDHFEGEWRSNNVGRTFVMRDILPIGSDFGVIKFTSEFSPKALLTLLPNMNDESIELQDVVFLDIETTNLSTGAGSIAFLIGLCNFSPKGVETILLFIEDPIDEPALLVFLDEELSKYKIIGSYNGKSFDIPFLMNRFVMHRMQSNSMQKPQIDLLHLSRKIWKQRIQNCKLSDIEREILVYKRSSEEVPGWLIPQIYFDFLDQRIPAQLEGVFYHNKIDVLSLAALFQFITKVIENFEFSKLSEAIDLASIARIYHKLNSDTLAAKFYSLGVKKGITNDHAAKVHRDFGYFLKKQKNWVDAVHHWELAANLNDVDSCIELAKYYEHTRKSNEQAFEWTLQAEKLLEASKQTHQKFGDILYRKERLSRKVMSIG